MLVYGPVRGEAGSLVDMWSGQIDCWIGIGESDCGIYFFYPQCGLSKCTKGEVGFALPSDVLRSYALGGDLHVAPELLRQASRPVSLVESSAGAGLRQLLLPQFLAYVGPSMRSGRHVSQLEQPVMVTTLKWPQDQ